ncbi:MAG: ABC transporter substrate-binding protein [Bacteroidetes bacterium]|jgi:ABC-type Fe3+-hydroxamate transport system substrate-binding protein|nr:ABC transporter substrate-binding protein [Bacteroidota bacterium]
MYSSIDQLGFAINLERAPERIISLVPSQTELLADLGLSSRIAGITRFCIYPPEVHISVPRVGGTKSVDLSRIEAINPDLIIANKEENTKEAIDTLRQKYKVWVSDINNLDEARDMIFNIGRLTDTNDTALKIIADISSRFEKLESETVKCKSLRALYLIWRRPYMAVAGNTFIHDMMSRCGFDNVLYYQSRYPELSAEQIRKLNPEVILLSSEPYPFSRKHISEFKEICPHARIKLVDGEYFSWYGSRMRLASDYFSELHHEVFNASE